MTRAPAVRRPAGRWVVSALALALTLTTLQLAAGPSGAHASSGPHVLLVGTWNGVHGQYSDIQAAVDAAGPGDWILIGPGDYHPRGVVSPEQAGVLVTTPGLHLRGMDRNAVVI